MMMTRLFIYSCEKARKAGLFILIWTLSSLLTTAMAAQSKPDFSGTWEMEGWSAEEWDVEPPYTAAGLAAFQEWESDPLSDPAHQCIFSLVRITTAPMLHEIIQDEERIVMLYEYEHQVRRAYIDRAHPEDPYPTFMGYSNAAWEGDSLVIEAVGLQAGYLRPQGVPHSDQLRVVETRKMLADGNTLTLETLIDDPVYFTKPWGVTTQWKKSDFEIMDYDCVARPHIGD
ncbi:MAG: hypothetical protein ACI934_000840 [Pseudohongiellaceae bacterium]|jgi:hypothetical protein